MKPQFLFYALFLFLLTCDNPISTLNQLDCIIDYRGFYDDCGVCSGGATNHTANSDQDCENNCFGSAVIDECGNCNGDGSTCVDGDFNYCNFNLGSFYDDCGNCVSGTSGMTENWDVNECGVCNQPDVDIDLCSVCSGNNTSCNLGLITLSKFNFDQMHIWNNSECTGAPYYSFYNEICLNGTCDDYSLLFYYDNTVLAGEELKFYQSNNSGNDFYSGDFTLNNQLCLNYNFKCNENCLDEYEFPDVGIDNTAGTSDDSWIEDSSIALDECWDTISFSNSYYDCINNIGACNNNTLILTQYNEESNSCYQVSYIGQSINSTFSGSNSQLINNLK